MRLFTGYFCLNQYITQHDVHSSSEQLCGIFYFYFVILNKLQHRLSQKQCSVSLTTLTFCPSSHIAYFILNISRTLACILIKQSNNDMPDLPLAGAASLSSQYDEFVNKANDHVCLQGTYSVKLNKSQQYILMSAPTA